MSGEEQLGVRALKLLDEGSMVAVLRGLAAGASRPAELERRLPHVGHSMVMRRLRRLLESELVSYEHRPGFPPQGRGVGVPHEARYRLTEAGGMLVDVADEASRWERTWWPRDARPDLPGGLAIKFAADPHARRIALLLADGPLSPRLLDERTAELGRSALRRRLRELVLAGLLELREQGVIRLYELTARARHLALLAMLAGRWEWRWSRPAHAVPGDDLGRLLRMLAPVARMGGQLNGVCQLQLRGPGSDIHEVFLAACAGSVHVLDGAPSTPPDAVGRASPEVFCLALLSAEQISMRGDRALLAAVIRSLSTALLA